LFACISNNLPTLSFCHVTEFINESHDLIIPEYTLTNVNVHTNGSVAILKANAETGSSCEHLLMSASQVSGLTHSTDHLSIGEGK
jgi:hypothetical protein